MPVLEAIVLQASLHFSNGSKTFEMKLISNCKSIITTMKNIQFLKNICLVEGTKLSVCISPSSHHQEGVLDLRSDGRETHGLDVG